jgi:hypothetical protein
MLFSDIFVSAYLCFRRPNGAFFQLESTNPSRLSRLSNTSLVKNSYSQTRFLPFRRALEQRFVRQRGMQKYFRNSLFGGRDFALVIRRSCAYPSILETGYGFVIKSSIS